MLKLILAAFAAIIFVSCTHVISTNYPGKPKTQLPSSWKGTYSSQMPGFLQFFTSGSDTVKSEVVIGKDYITWTADKTVSHYTTADSLKFSELDGKRYLSLQNSHDQYTVFQVKETKNGLELFGLTADDDIDGEQLEPYFSNVEEIETSDTAMETGIKLFQVTIDDKKIAAYFSSGIPAKDPIILSRIK